MILIEFKHVRKEFENFVALHDVNLKIHKGELFTLIGPSGCGKTTTLRMINRLTEPTSGQILIDGQDISNFDPVMLRRNIGYIIQEIGLFPHMTIEQNISLVPRLKKEDPEKYLKRVDELLELVGLDPKIYKHRTPSELSGGQQQRVGVIRALAADPDIILMDEHFSALDPISREQLQDDIIELQEKIQKTIVFITHDMDEAIKIADMIAIMNEGEIIQIDTPDRILRNPKNDFVKGFIGENRLKQTIGLPTAKDFMQQEVITFQRTRKLTEAIEKMKGKSVDSLFVTNQANEWIGLVTLQDVQEHDGDKARTVEDIMQTDIETLDADDVVTDAAKIFQHQNISAIPVLDGNKLIGAVTQPSLIRGLAQWKQFQGDDVSWN